MVDVTVTRSRTCPTRLLLLKVKVLQMHPRPGNQRLRWSKGIWIRYAIIYKAAWQKDFLVRFRTTIGINLPSYTMMFFVFHNNVVLSYRADTAEWIDSKKICSMCSNMQERWAGLTHSCTKIQRICTSSSYKHVNNCARMVKCCWHRRSAIKKYTCSGIWR